MSGSGHVPTVASCVRDSLNNSSCSLKDEPFVGYLSEHSFLEEGVAPWKWLLIQHILALREAQTELSPRPEHQPSSLHLKHFLLHPSQFTVSFRCHEAVSSAGLLCFWGRSPYTRCDSSSRILIAPKLICE
jgi:hypothetical protein